jgi:hypothetical protein
MKGTFSPFLLRCAALTCASLLLASTAQAAFIGSAVTMRFFTQAGSGTFDVPIPSDADPLNWHLDAPVDVYSSTNPGELVARIDSLSLELDGDPAVSLNFSLTANAAPTMVMITSSTVAFTPIINSSTFATAAITVTDVDNNGATLTGMFPGGKAYEARYNGTSVYADLVSPIVALPNDSNTGSERFPALGTVLIPSAVSSIQSQFAFLLSANDSASGTSRFNVAPGQIVPEPSSYVLAAMGLVGYFWFRRRRVAS